MGADSMEKTQIKLSKTVLENVFRILYQRLESGAPNIFRASKDGPANTQTRTVINSDYPDGITRTVTYHYELQRPHWSGNKLTAQEHYYIGVYPGKSDITSEEIVKSMFIDALIITGYQLQTDTVKLEIEYLEHWQDLVNSLILEIQDLFGEQTTNQPGQTEKPKESTINTHGYNYTFVEHLEKLKRGDFDALAIENSPEWKTSKETFKRLREVMTLTPLEEAVYETIVLQDFQKSPTARALLINTPFWEIKAMLATIVREKENPTVLPADQPEQIKKAQEPEPGKYDDLCKKWVNRPSTPYMNKSEFLNEHAPNILSRNFDRILMDAYKRGVIDKTPGIHGRYKPKI